MFYIEMQRLKLLPLSHTLLQLCKTNRHEMEKVLGLQPSSMKIDPLYQAELNDALEHFWLPKTLEHPHQYQWYTNWEIILKEMNTSIGGIGFIGYPDNNGETELGYMLDELHQGSGYALEALLAITSWAFDDFNTKIIKARTPDDNFPSQKLLLKAGFIKIGVNEGLVSFKKTR